MELAFQIGKLLGTFPIDWNEIDPLLNFVNEGNVHEILMVINNQYEPQGDREPFVTTDEEGIEYEKGLVEIIDKLSERRCVGLLVN